MTVLAATAGLANELAFLLDRFANRLAIRHLRLTDVRLDPELALHAIDDNVEVQLAHPGNDRLPDSSSVCTRNDGSSFASFCSAMPIFSWSGFVFGSTATEITGSGNSMRSSVICLLEVTQRVACRYVLETNCRGDIARPNFLDLFAIVRVHLQNSADALFLALHRVVNRVARIQYARIDPEECQVADETDPSRS